MFTFVLISVMVLVGLLIVIAVDAFKNRYYIVGTTLGIFTIILVFIAVKLILQYFG